MTRRTIARITRRGLVLAGAAAGGLAAAPLPRRVFAQTATGQLPLLPSVVQRGAFSASALRGSLLTKAP